ncbi:META domain-containing protein [Streptomyces sp. NPDC002845]
MICTDAEPAIRPARHTGMDKMRLTLTALAVFPLLAACGSETGNGGGSGSGSGSVGSGGVPASVAGVHWTVDSLTVDGTTSKAPGSAYLKIAEDGTVDGNLGCNGFGGTATMEGERVEFGEYFSTGMACEDVSMEFEESLSDTLTGAALKAETADGRLTLTSDDGNTVELSEEKPAELYGTTWQVNSLVSGDTVQSLPDGSDGKAWLTFDKQAGTVSGSLGCNRVTARATVSDGTITLGPAGATRRMCDGSLMETERALLKLFNGTVSYEIDHRAITLTSEKGLGIGAVAGK